MAVSKKTVRQLDVGNRTVLVRVDFNVPLADGRVADDTRLRATVPTINLLRKNNGKIVLVSHLGRPKGKAVESLRLAPVAKRLSTLLDAPVQTAPDCVGPVAEAAAQALQPGEVLLLENVRFHPGEEANDSAFARELATLGEVYVNDAFGAAHRAHASTEGVCAYLPSVAGLLMEREVATLSQLLQSPEQPFVALIGGAKISTKIGVLRHLFSRIDALVVGGGIANTFLKAQGFAVGESLVEDEQLSVAKELLAEAKESGVYVLLPRDVVVGPRADATGQGETVGVGAIPQCMMIGDVGPDTVKDIQAVLASARTVLWNGPLGLFEQERFAGSTSSIAQALAESSAVTIVGGGETVAAVEACSVAEEITHVSTGGGATLEFLEGKTLPGVAALDDA